MQHKWTFDDNIKLFNLHMTKSWPKSIVFIMRVIWNCASTAKSCQVPPLTELLLFIYFWKSSDRSSPVCWQTQAPQHPLARPQRAFASAPPLPHQFAPCRYCPRQRLGLKMERDGVCRRKWTEVSMCIATHFLIAFFKYANWPECIIAFC